ncbi:NAD(P)-dependent oxidoreductase [Alphaproteobacteria bacterium]|nr:NAD(P)-dependent oxidoreductase [Alphaproteobacteria bacterium]
MSDNKLNKRIIIFGGSGFLGLRLTKALFRFGYDIIIVDLINQNIVQLENVSFIKMDLQKKDIDEFIEIRKSDIFINLASRQYHNKVPYFKRQKWFDEVNYHASKNIMRIAIKKEIRGFIHFSTDMVYGLTNGLIIDEKFKPNPIAEYGKSKLKAEKSLRKSAKNYLPLTIFRPRLISGPGRLGVFIKLFNLIDKSKTIPLIGNGLNCYQMVSVDDCVSAILLSLEKNIIDDTFNLASDKKILVIDLIKNLIIYSKSNSKLLPINSLVIKTGLYLADLVGLTLLYKEQYSIADKDIFLDISKAQKKLNWKPKFNDLEMIKTSYDYWQNLKKN